MCCVDIDVLLWRLGSSFRSFSITSKAGFIGTDHIHNNQDFLEHLKGIKLASDEVMMSYDVKALFTSVPIKPALDVIEKLLKEDPSLQSRTSMSTQHIMDLLEFCLRSTYFTF